MIADVFASAVEPTDTRVKTAIARALARRHGADVTVTSRYGSGSEFVASFPTRPARID